MAIPGQYRKHVRRADQELSFENRLGRHFSFEVKAEWEWDSRPGRGIDPHDVSLSVGINIRG